MFCSKCKEPVTDFVLCQGGKCDGRYHYHCAGVSESTYRKMGNEKKALWRCLVCRGGLSPTTSQQPESLSLLEVIKEIKAFRADFDIMQRDVVTIKQELSNTSQVITQLESKWNGLEKRFTDMEERLVNVEGTVASLATVPQQLMAARQTIDQLTQDINHQNQFSRLNNIEIQGVPQLNSENLHNILSTICNKVGMTLLDTDIDTIHRVRVFRGDKNQDVHNRPPSIIVRFTQRQRKNQLIAAARARRGLTTADIGLAGPATSVHINEHLTPANKLLLKKAREIKINLNYTYLWIRDCKIFLRKNDLSRIVRIASELDLLKLK